MLAWILYGEKEAEYNKHYIQMYQEEGKQFDLDVELILVEKLDFGVSNGTYFLEYEQKPIQAPVFVISRVIDPLLSSQLECMKIPVFNRAEVARICNDKALTYQFIAAINIPMVDTIFCKKGMLLKKLERRTTPTVVKTVAGHGGQQVYLLDPTNQDEIDKVVMQTKEYDTVVQPLIGTKHEDLRVYVIGKTIIAAILRKAKEGFKSNFSLGGEVCVYELNHEERQCVQSIIELLEPDMVGIDFIIGDEGELIFNEIEDVVGARMLYQCTDINLVKLYLEYILDHL
ncbi:ATP-grasp domain-containing protein [Anaerosporobacter faecicola]|uniref:ATP-grasp domain-containing protein n=1 Tax=Anaerosporobacter faecicola TaxID=2718714 RepID=UPI00143A4A28|nr:ATP-grasp domain-containing protein [Anaerosporobacter faecicola]